MNAKRNGCVIAVIVLAVAGVVGVFGAGGKDDGQPGQAVEERAQGKEKSPEKIMMEYLKQMAVLQASVQKTVAIAQVQGNDTASANKIKEALGLIERDLAVTHQAIGYMMGQMKKLEDMQREMKDIKKQMAQMKTEMGTVHQPQS